MYENTNKPEIYVSLVSDEWKALQSDSDLDSIDKEQRIEHYWNGVFLSLWPTQIGTLYCHVSSNLG